MQAKTNITPSATPKLRIWSVKRQGKSAPAEYSVIRPISINRAISEVSAGSNTARRCRPHRNIRPGRPAAAAVIACSLRPCAPAARAAPSAFDAWAMTRAAGGASSGSRGTAPAGALPSRYWSKAMRAIGAAAIEPKPPFSTSSASAIAGLSAGAKAMNSEWSRWRSSILDALYFSFCLMPMTCAVPVLPATL